MQPPLSSPARRRAARSYRRGVSAESAACAALEADGWTIRARRFRTPAGEIDILAAKDGLLALVEVKARPTLIEAASALSPRQQRRLLAAGALVATEHPEWCPQGLRYDLLLVDAAGTVRRIADAFREE